MKNFLKSNNQPLLKRFYCLKHLFSIGIILLFVSGNYLWMAWYQAIDFWSTANDYANLSLAQAINIESWIKCEGERIVEYFQVAHPGLLFQIMSWICLRITGIFTSPDLNILANHPHVALQFSVLRDPYLFWRISQAATLFLTLNAIGLLWYLSRRLTLIPRLAVCLVFFCYSQSYVFGLFQLGIESFALLTGTLFFWLSLKVFSENKSSLWYIVLGVLGSLAYLNKLTYIVWSLSFLFGLIIQTILLIPNNPKETLERFIKKIFLFCSSWLVTVVLLSYALLGFKGVSTVYKQHMNFALPANIKGEPTFLSLNAIFTNLKTILNHHSFILIIVILIGATLYILFRKRKDSFWMQNTLPIGVCFLGGIIFSFAGPMLKRFGLHYFVTTTAVFPIMFIWIYSCLSKKISQWLGIIILILVTANNYNMVSNPPLRINNQMFQYYPYLNQNVSQLKREIQEVENLPLPDKNVLLWTYCIADAHAYRLWIALMACDKELFSLLSIYYPNDRYLDIWNFMIYTPTYLLPEYVPWKYAIFDRRIYSEFTKLNNYFLNNGREVPGFQQLLVVERLDKITEL